MTEEREACFRYARSILGSGGGYMSRLLTERVDLTQGRFETTADFTAFSDRHWEMTPGGRRDNMRIEDPTSERGWRFEPNQALVEKLLPWLAREGRLLVVEQTVSAPMPPLRDAPPPLRIVRRDTAQTVEVYLLLASPEPRESWIMEALTWMGWDAREVEVLVEYDGDLPPPGSAIDTAFLSDVLTNVIGVFMRQTSFDAHLLWWRE